jgi:hypothetical protein
MGTWIRDVLNDPAGADYNVKTWSLTSGHGTFCVVHGMYGGSTTNSGTESNERDKGQTCLQNATLGTFMGWEYSEQGSGTQGTPRHCGLVLCIVIPKLSLVVCVSIERENSPRKYIYSLKCSKWGKVTLHSIIRLVCGTRNSIYKTLLPIY